MKERKVYNKACAGCVYMTFIAGYLGCCDYIFMEGKRRPCPPGKGCTVKKKKGKKVTEDGKNF